MKKQYNIDKIPPQYLRVCVYGHARVFIEYVEKRRNLRSEKQSKKIFEKSLKNLLTNEKVFDIISERLTEG